MKELDENEKTGEDVDEERENTKETAEVVEPPSPIVKDETTEKNVRKKLNVGGYFKGGLSAVWDTFTRFPLTILLCIALGAIAIYRIEVPYQEIKDFNDILDRIMLVLVLGIPLSLSCDLFIERFFIKPGFSKKLISSLIQIVLLVLYYCYVLVSVDNMVSGVRHLCLTAALGLTFLFMPYLFNKENYEIYITRVGIRAIISGFFSVVLGAGISATLFAIQSLLYNGMDSKWYAYAWIIVWSVFAPLHFLYGLPHKEDTFAIENYNKVLKVLLMYIVMPLIVVYTIVLYIYFGKIMVTRVWPKGIVSYLVLSYTAAGIAAVFLTTPLKEISGWVRKFISVFTKLIFPLLIMMFVSIGIRIGEFGVTESRYFIVLVGIWSTLAMLYINFNKGRRNILLPISLAVILLIAVAGSLSAFNISKTSQNNRFYNILSKNNMISNGSIIKNSNISDIDKKEIMGILWYFNGSHELKDLKYLPAGFKIENVKNVFGFSQEDIKDMPNAGYNYFSYNSNESNALPITGYEYLFKLQLYKYRADDTFIYQQETNDGAKKTKLTVDKTYKLRIFSENELVYQKDLNEFAASLYSKYGAKYNESDIKSQDLTIADSNEKVDVKIVFGRISGTQRSDNEGLQIDEMDGYALVKIK